MSDVMGIRTNTNNGSKFVFSSLELHQLNKAGNIQQFFNKVLKGEFGL
jgi:hypothetical protein